MSRHLEPVDELRTDVMEYSVLDSFVRAKMHPIISETPAPDFFEGALLGNGGLGAVVTTRPDAIVIHFGHNNVWDIRHSEPDPEEIGTFEDVFKKVLEIPKDYNNARDDEWFAEYYTTTRQYYNKPYPRPFPCGSLLLGFDRGRAELLGHKLDISTGLCEVSLLVDGESRILQVFTDMGSDKLWLWLVDSNGNLCPQPFERIKLIPDPKTPSEIPPPQPFEDLDGQVISFRQVLPYQEPEEYDLSKGHPKDKAFSLTVRTSGSLGKASRINWHGKMQEMRPLECKLSAQDGFIACVQLSEGVASSVPDIPSDIPEPTGSAFLSAALNSLTAWDVYWNKSGIELEDEFLERIWYRNLYFLNCSMKPGVTCPGLFGNWSYENIGTAWHGDYHLNYNTQQPFWVTFSSNHIDKHLPYVDLVDHLLPVSRSWAQDYYGLRGAAFPHSAYPVDMKYNPYPVPIWGWEICETPWAVQSLWWHYLYTADKDFLKERAFGPIKEAVTFLADYMRRPEADGSRWGDDRYHVYPTVVPEVYGIRPGLTKNRDCLIDLALIKFIFKAYLQAVAILGAEADEAELADNLREILGRFPEYPTADSDYGEVFVSVPGGDSDIVYNVPMGLMTVFPGEEHGLGSPEEIRQILHNTNKSMRVEGGNDLVFYPLQLARIGELDIEKFKRQVAYCLMPNGSCTDMVMQVHGRYGDTTAYDFMSRMGVWVENFALPAVINECMLQSYDGLLRLFPNWPKEKNAEFYSLRAVGGFLVSASLKNGDIQWVEITSEAGMPLKVVIPWGSGARCITATSAVIVREPVFEIETSPGEVIRMTAG